MDRISRCSHGLEGVWFSSHWISSLLFADDVVLLVPLGQDLQHVLGRFVAACEAAGMRISPSKSEAVVVDRKTMACSLRVGGELLPQVEKFKYLRPLFTNEGRVEREIDRRIGAAAAVMWAQGSVSDAPWTTSSGDVPGMPKGRPRARWRDYVARLAWEPLGILPQKLEEVSREGKSGCPGSDSCPHDPAPDKRKKLAGWMVVKKLK